MWGDQEVGFLSWPTTDPQDKVLSLPGPRFPQWVGAWGLSDSRFDVPGFYTGTNDCPWRGWGAPIPTSHEGSLLFLLSAST